MEIPTFWKIGPFQLRASSGRPASVSGVFVVDASATVKLLVEETGTEQARLFFGRLTQIDPPAFYAPDLLYVECANAVCKYVTLYRYPLRHAEAALETLTALALHPIPTQELFLDAFALSIRHRISNYDACYLALAQGLSCPLITEDSNLTRTVRRHAEVPLYSLAEAVSLP